MTKNNIEKVVKSFRMDKDILDLLDKIAEHDERKPADALIKVIKEAARKRKIPIK